MRDRREQPGSRSRSTRQHTQPAQAVDESRSDKAKSGQDEVCVLIYLMALDMSGLSFGDRNSALYLNRFTMEKVSRILSIQLG